MSILRTYQLATLSVRPQIRCTHLLVCGRRYIRLMDSRFASPGDIGQFLHYGGTGGTHSLDSDYVIVDVETSGLDPAQGARIIEIAAVRVTQSGAEVGHMSSLINPGDGETGADWIHGITPAMILDAPKFSEVFDAFAEHQRSLSDLRSLSNR